MLKELDIQAPTGKDKGKIMKVLMPKVKGIADGKLVNQVLGSMMNYSNNSADWLYLKKWPKDTIPGHNFTTQ